MSDPNDKLPIFKKVPLEIEYNYIPFLRGWRLKTLQTIGVLLPILIAALGGYIYLEERYALAAEQQKLRNEFELYKLEQTHVKALDEYYDFRQLQRKYPHDEELKKKVDHSKETVNKLEKKMEVLDEKVTKDN